MIRFFHRNYANLRKKQPIASKMTQAAALETNQANGQTATVERKRQKTIALKAISLQLKVNSEEIEEWCDRSEQTIFQSSRGELEVTSEAMEAFVRQFRDFQGRKQAELDIAILTQSQPVTISMEAARELGLLEENSEVPQSKPEFTLRGVKKGQNSSATLRAVVNAQPDDRRFHCLETLKSEGEEGQTLRKRIVKNIYAGKVTESGLLRAAQKLSLESD